MENPDAVNLKPDLGTRLGAMVLDHFIMNLLISLLVGVFMAGSFVNFLTGLKATHDPQTIFDFDFGLMLSGFIIGYAIYFSKDAIQGRSIAKRITKLRIVNHETGSAAGPWRALVRNLFIIIWPVEVIMVLVNPSRRIGDYVAGTRVEKWHEDLQEAKPDWKTSLISIGALIVVLMLVSWPARPYLNINERFGSTVVESSEAPELAGIIEAILFENLGELGTPDVKVWTEMHNETYAYVSVIIEKNMDNYGDNPVYVAEDVLTENLPYIIPGKEIKVHIQSTQPVSGLPEQINTFYVESSASVIEVPLGE